MIKIISFVILLLGNLVSSHLVEAKVIQILHTNDTHSFLEHTTHNDKIAFDLKPDQAIPSTKIGINLIKPYQQ